MVDSAQILDPILRLLVVMFRMCALFMFFPIFGQANINPTIKICASFAFSLCLLPAVSSQLPHWSVANLPPTSELFNVAIREFVIGAGMGLVAKWFYSACLSASEWVGTQIGFAMGSMFNSETQENISSWAEFNQWVGMMLFFSIGGVGLMIQALVDSYLFNFSHMADRLLNPSAGALFWIEIVGSFFHWMLKLSGPMVAVLLLLQLSLGVLSKFVPQINIWMVSIPITLGVGVLVFSLMSPMYGDALKHLFADQIQGQYLWLKYIGVR